MIDIEQIKSEIVERLKPLNPDKVILFGSYAYGTPTKDSDIDLFLIKDGIATSDMRNYKLELQKKLIQLQKKYLIGIDLFVDSSRVDEKLNIMQDQFYSDIINNGKIIYAK